MAVAQGFYRGDVAKNGHHFPDPFLDMASLTLPRSQPELLNLAEFLWLKNGTYRMGASRIVRYFVTSVDFQGQDNEQSELLESFLTKRLRVQQHLIESGDNHMAYGNDFTSLIRPFRRFLRCRNCRRTEQPIESANWEFRDFAFHAYCPACRKKTPHAHIDRRSLEEDRFRIQHWSPHEIRVLYNPYSKYSKYFWDIPQSWKTEIRKGTKHYIESMPWGIIETVRKNELFEFAPEMVYHMLEPTLAGVQTHGWGTPRLLSNWTQAWYVQVLKRYNEALAMDYVMPFRTLSPPATRTGAAGGTPGSDPIASMDMGDFSASVHRMLKHHRRDPATWHVLPFPVEYQSLGGEASQMAPTELMDQGMDELLNGIGIPANLYRFDLELQVMPTALRLFQQDWTNLVDHFNAWLEWITEQSCTYMNWDKPETIRLKPVTLADDLELRTTWLQLASANMISRQTAFGPWNVNAREEQERIFREQAEFAEAQREHEENMRQKQMMLDQMSGAGNAQGPGGPAGAGGGAGAVTPGDMMQKAQQLAQSWLEMPYEARRTEMQNVKNTDETLWALAKAQMQQMRQDARSQGGQELLQQQSPQGAAVA